MWINVYDSDIKVNTAHIAAYWPESKNFIEPPEHKWKGETCWDKRYEKELAEWNKKNKVLKGYCIKIAGEEHFTLDNPEGETDEINVRHK